MGAVGSINYGTPTMSLTHTSIRTLDKSWKLSDAQGLYLLIKPNGSKLWQRSRRKKKQQEKFARKSGNTFEDIARKWVAANIRRNEAHAAKVLRSLELHVFH